MAARAGGGPPAEVETVETQLERMYMDVLRPLEEEYQFGEFVSPILTPADFSKKPMVLLLGQYSVGKTSFIRYLLGRDFPGIRIGPEPTTERFSIVVKGDEDRVIPGNALAVHKDLPFTSLKRFGTGFLNRLEASQCASPMLDNVTLVDTPGVLSGEKQRIGRQYDFVRVVEWFAERADMILLLFDAHKLDISDEFKSTIEALKGHDDKIRVILNKADKVTSQQLMRVYGAMMWALGKVINTPEVPRVYIGSFWDGPCMNPDFEAMFSAERSDLLRDLRNLPRDTAVRKVNEIVKRARMARVHALIIAHLRSKMPTLFGHKKAQDKLIAEMPKVFWEIQKKYRLPTSDFPDPKRFVEVAKTYEFSRFKKLNQRMLDSAQAIITDQIPTLLQALGRQTTGMKSLAAGTQLTMEHGEIRELGAGAPAPAPRAASPAPAPAAAAGGGGGGEAPRARSANNPFAKGNAGTRRTWAAVVDKDASDQVFYTLLGAREEGRVAGSTVMDLMMESGLGQDQLGEIWELSDIDQDGFLNDREFAVMRRLLEDATQGKPVPTSLPDSLRPPTA